MDIKTEFAGRLSSLLEERGLSGRGEQAYLGKVVGLTANGAAKWLKGTAMPSMENAIILARHFEVSVEWLLSGQDSKIPRNFFNQHSPQENDPALRDMVQWLYEFWLRAPKRDRNWAEVQFEKAFPEFKLRNQILENIPDSIKISDMPSPYSVNEPGTPYNVAKTPSDTLTSHS